MRKPFPVLAPAAASVAAALLLAACAPEAEPASRTDAGGELEELAERYWEWSLEQNPVRATQLGDDRYDDRLRDISPRAREDRRERRESFLEELRLLDPGVLSGPDRITYRVLEETLEADLATRVCRFPIWRVDHRSDPAASFQTLAEFQPLEDSADARDMVRRWRAMGSYLEDRMANLEAGLSEDRVAPRINVELVIDQLESTLARPDSAWPLLDPLDRMPGGWTEEERASFRAELEGAVAESIRPAFRRYRDFLSAEVLPEARTGDDIGVGAARRGETCYGTLILDHTSLELSPEEIHRFGREAIERIEGEMRELGRDVFGTGDLEEVQARLRNDPEMHFGSEEEILRKAEEATDRARSAIPGWFGTLPETRLAVRPVPAHEAPYTTVAYYRRPAADGSRPGIYYVNTHEPETRTRYEAEVLAFHEGIPGHHVQIALAQEGEDLPAFRRHGGATAFVEGWALYTERLAAEMDLYSGALDRLGMLSFDAWRASRLIVDTGIHAFGWTREEAIDYMMDHTLLAANNVENEVNRYVAWPGQALAYKLGQREMLRLRKEAEGELGERFRIREFHDRVLENGAVSLAILRERMERWMEEAGAP